MSHYQAAVINSKEFLTDLQLAYVFSTSIFDEYYNEAKKTTRNPYEIGKMAADRMIMAGTPEPEENED